MVEQPMDHVEWHIADTDAEWEQWQRADDPHAPARSAAQPGWRRRFPLGAAIVFLLLLSIGGYRLWRVEQMAQMEQMEQARLRAELRAVLERDVRNRAQPSVEHGIDPEVSRAWREQFQWEAHMMWSGHEKRIPEPEIDIHSVQVHGDIAEVDATMSLRTADGAVSAMRSTRFYRHTAAGWLRTAPDPAFWGEQQTLETAYFRFTFRQRDADAVRQVAADVDERYRTLRRDLGLPLPMSTAQKMLVVVSMSEPLRFNFFLFDEADQMVLPSPALQLAPSHLSDAALLRQSLSLLLGEKVLTEWGDTLDTNRAELDWMALLPALRLWQIWEHDDALAAGHADLVRWIYMDAAEKLRDRRYLLPRNYSQICDTFRPWKLTPTNLAIPLACSDQDPPIWYNQRAFLHLRDLAQPTPESTEYQYAAHIYLTLATVIEYVVAKYGRAQLPALLKAVDSHGNWDTLIPTVFGVSVEEFEAGWHRYISEQYDVKMPDSIGDTAPQ